MCDMFIQNQQTSSVNSSSSNNNSNNSSNNITAHHHSKKRKLDYNTNQPVIQHSLVQSSVDYQLDNTGLQRYSVSGNNATFNNTLSNNNALQKSPNSSNTLMRASTIKLLDTYHRCGQKVCRQNYYLKKNINNNY